MLKEPYYLGFIFGPLIAGNSHIPDNICYAKYTIHHIRHMYCFRGSYGERLSPRRAPKPITYFQLRAVWFPAVLRVQVPNWKVSTQIQRYDASYRNLSIWVFWSLRVWFGECNQVSSRGTFFKCLCAGYRE